MDIRYTNASILSCDITHNADSDESFYTLNVKTAQGTPIIHVRNADFAFHLLNILDVKHWSELPGTCLRLETKNGKLVALHHIIEGNSIEEQDWQFLFSKF